jgi:hypothetical protein
MHLDHKTKELPSKGEHSDDPKAWQDEGFTYLPARADCTQIVREVQVRWPRYSPRKVIGGAEEKKRAPAYGAENNIYSSL